MGKVDTLAWIPVHAHLRVSTEPCDGGPALVRLAGELDLASSPVARRILLDAAAKAGSVAVDLSWVTFCDTSGIECLLQTRAGIADGAELVVLHPHRSVRHVLELAGLSVDFDTVGSAWPSATWALDTDVLTVLETTIDEAIKVSGSDMATAQVLDPRTGTLRIAAHRGFGGGFLDFFEVVTGRESACGAALVDERPVWVADVTRSQIFTDSPALDTLLDADARGVASVPVRSPTNEPLAVFSTHRTRVGEWTTSQRSALVALGRAAGMQLSHV